jgi:hypothetical protein
MTRAPETNQSLWRLIVPPGIWAAHFMLSYATVSIWCAKAADLPGSFWQVRAVIAVYSIVALATIGVTGWAAYGNCVAGGSPLSQDTPESRQRFLGYATLLLSALSGVATAFATLVLFFFRSCA